MPVIVTYHGDEFESDVVFWAYHESRRCPKLYAVVHGEVVVCKEVYASYTEKENLKQLKKEVEKAEKDLEKAREKLAEFRADMKAHSKTYQTLE